MEKDIDGKLTVDEFIKVFLEAEKILTLKIKKTKDELENYHK